MSKTRFAANPYYSPEKCGLAVIGELEDPDANYSFDINADYSFDMVVVWRHIESGKLFGTQDAGCSCPTPFEDYTTLESLTALNSVEDFDALVRTGCEYRPGDVAELRDAVRRALEGDHD